MALGEAGLHLPQSRLRRRSSQAMPQRALLVEMGLAALEGRRGRRTRTARRAGGCVRVRPRLADSLSQAGIARRCSDTSASTERSRFDGREASTSRDEPGQHRQEVARPDRSGPSGSSRKLRHLPQHLGRGDGVDVGVGEPAGIAARGPGGRALAVDDGDLVALVGQGVGAGEADEARADDGDFHDAKITLMDQ